MSTRPAAIQRAFVLRETATLWPEMSMPETRPVPARVASLSIVFPPPHPTSRIVNAGAIWTWASPQSVTAEWRRFINQSESLPGHPAGLRTRVGRSRTAPMATTPARMPCASGDIGTAYRAKVPYDTRTRGARLQPGSLLPQDRDRIDVAGAPGRQPRGGERRGEQRRRNHGESQRIGRGDLEQQPREPARPGQRQHQA